MLDSAKALTADAAAAATQRLLTDKEDIEKLLSLRNEASIALGMSSVISLMAKGQDVSSYFADVVKNISSSHYKITSLVMVYLIAYANVEPDTALLSINSIQRSLNDTSPVARSKSIRSLAGVQMSCIAQVLALSIKRVMTDPSPIVRCEAAFAIASAYEISESNRKQLFGFLTRLLGDPAVDVVSAAVTAFYRIKSSRYFNSKMWAAIHGHFRRLTLILAEVGEWNQVIIIKVLTEYSRAFLPQPRKVTISQDLESVYFDEWCIDDDLWLFIKLLLPLVYSNSESVILEAAKALFALAPVRAFHEFRYDVALLRIAANPMTSPVAPLALKLISRIIDDDDMAYREHYKRFFISPAESESTAVIKLEILLKLASDLNFRYIYQEFKYYARHSESDKVASKAVESIGYCSQISHEWSKTIFDWCLRQIRSNKHPKLLTSLLGVLRFLIQQAGGANTLEITKSMNQLLVILADDNLDLNAGAKASMIWLIGEYGAIGGSAHEALKILLKRFALELEDVRYQTLMLASKMFIQELANQQGDSFEMERFTQHNQHAKLFQHTLYLAKYDANYDTRCRARMLDFLFNQGDGQTQLALLFLEAPKPCPVFQLSLDGEDNGHLKKFLEVRPWCNMQDIPPSSIREAKPVEDDLRAVAGVSSHGSSQHHSPAPITKSLERTVAHENGGSKPATYKLQSLDEFFDGDDDEEIDESDEDEEEDEEEDDEEEEEDEESDDAGNDQVRQNEENTDGKDIEHTRSEIAAAEISSSEEDLSEGDKAQLLG